VREMLEHSNGSKNTKLISEPDPFVWNVLGHCGSYFESVPNTVCACTLCMVTIDVQYLYVIQASVKGR